MRKRVICIILCILLVLASIAGLCLSAFAAEAPEEPEKDTANCCTFVVPPVFVPGEEKNVYVNKSYPMESSIIRCSSYYNGEDIVLTNRERKEQEAAGVTKQLSEPNKLSRQIYQETMAAAYNSQYGEDVGFEVSSFENITIDEFPGFKISSTYKAADEEKIYQTVYMIISKYRVFTITFQRAEDDDCEAYFEECAATIHVH
jgi:hypothetical protein